MLIENYIHIYLAEFNLLNKHIKICTLGFPITLNLPPSRSACPVQALQLGYEGGVGVVGE